MANTDRQSRDARRGYDLARDNVTVVRQKIHNLQRELMDLTANDNRPSRTRSELEKAKMTMERNLSALDKERITFTKAQEKYTEAQESFKSAQMAHNKLQEELHAEEKKTLVDQDRERKQIEDKIKQEEKAEKSWSIKMQTTESELRKLQENAANDTHQDKGRQNRLRA